MSDQQLDNEIERHERTAEALRQSDATIQALLDATMETALLIDTEGRILALNEVAFERLKRLSPLPVGDSVESLLGRDVFDLFPDVLATRRRARNDGVIRSGLPARFEDDRDGRWMDNTIYPIFDSEGTVTKLAVFSYDVTERKGAEMALQRALRDEQERARRDPLTGVLNHRAIIEELQKVADRAAITRSHAVFMVDVDGLKAINDTHGHRIGDAALVSIAEALRRNQSIVGRYGGDEFVTLLPGADYDRAEQFTRDVEAKLATTELTTDTMRGNAISLGASIGFAIYPNEARTVTKLIDLADDRMYAARGQRSNIRPISQAA